ncbi:MAG: hypothetical protein J7J88_03610 [Dehalococcoidia bacterium]|nr:hypothetical protein [Dehalococcoidia bacterium]
MHLAKHLVFLSVGFLFIILPSPVLALTFSVSPAEVKVAHLEPGQEVTFNITISNKDNINHVFTLDTYNPKESERRPGEALFPVSSWISFLQQVDVPANSNAQVKVTIDIPESQEWYDKNWEIWLKVSADEESLVTVNYYIRLLVSTTDLELNTSYRWIIGVIVTIIFFSGYTVYRSRRREEKLDA